MATYELKPSLEVEDPQDEDYHEEESSEIDGASDDSDEDPTFTILEETQLSLSKISLKKTRPRISKENESGSQDGMESMEVEIPELDEKDAKCFEKIEKLIKDGKLEKLKVDECKIYLRKYGLRLTGNKDILISRIREHLEIKDGGGEIKYPSASFVLNCKGDSCTGDVVMFEQNVYEMYSIVSRSATGPSCGTRTVVGRIVKESYGAAKQQHTFTIEVLWSKGEKPLPPLHPLLIKGRNLYRLMTRRQRWADEGERRKVLEEKHTRGSRARCSRENRIQEKEMRQMGRPKSCRMKENLQKKVDPIQSKHHQSTTVSEVVKNILPEHKHPSIKYDGFPQASNPCLIPQTLKPLNQASTHVIPQAPPNPHSIRQPLKPLNSEHQAPPQLHIRPQAARNYHQATMHLHHHYAVDEQFQQYRQAGLRPQFSYLSNWGPRPQHYPQQRQQCRYYLQGRCYYSEDCRFGLHGYR